MYRRKNLVFIFTDQQRYDSMACYGNHAIRTPNLNALADQSFVFDRAYVTQPICTPSRASLLTGLYPHACGCIANNIPLRPETPCIAEMVDPAYARGYIGKWHLGDEITAQHGFETWISIEDFYRDYYSRPEYRNRVSDYARYLQTHGFEPNTGDEEIRFFSRRMAAALPDPYNKASFVGQEAQKFIQAHRHQPFLLYVNFLEPHSPYINADPSEYGPDHPPAGPTFLVPPDETASGRNRRIADYYSSQDIQGLSLREEKSWRELRRHYHANISLVDHAAGGILQSLAECGLAEDTLVVFTSDHGDMMGDHRLLAKSVMYEEAARVPLLLHAPWLSKESRRVQGSISQIDLVPTLLGLLEQPIPAELQGCNRGAILHEKNPSVPDDVFIAWHGEADSKKTRQEGKLDHWRTVISGGWKLNLSRVDLSELYELNRDPHEIVNRFNDPDQQGRIRDMTARIRAWQAQTNDSLPL